VAAARLGLAPRCVDQGLGPRPSRHRSYFHHRRDTPGLKILHRLLDLVEWIDFYAAEFAPLLHRDRRVVIGGRRLHADGRVPQIRKAPDRGRLRAVDHQAQRRCKIGNRPGQYPFALGRDGDATHDAVVAPALHLLEDRLPVCVDEHGL
jgi:hypothetical protein